MSIFSELVATLKDLGRPVFIQTHNFPDHDAVAAAYGLQQLLGAYEIVAHIVYEGDIQRDSLREMIHELGISLIDNDDIHIHPEDKIIVVDGCKGNKNVLELPGEEIAVIDHHEVECPDDVPLCDLRSGYGSCSSIVYSYYAEAGLALPRPVATALMIGICMDTSLLTRKVHEADIRAYVELFPHADVPLQNRILRNYIQTQDLDFFRHALEHVVIDTEERMAFCYFPDGCNQNLLGVLGDFFLSLREISFVALCAKNGGVINLSVRNELPHLSASAVIQDVLKGMGFGGGHADMAGGIIKDLRLFVPEKMRNKFLAHVRAAQPA